MLKLASSFVLGWVVPRVWSCLDTRYHCPDHENAAEFLADLISTDYSSAESVESSLERIENLINEFANNVPMTEFNSPVTQLEGSEFSTKVAQKST
ncbi:ABC transporter G family member 7 [Hordeum vulgare]|nr:ABC transporter G family member 7 [Hordeum vulgare]